jgi:hypothetical protein
MSTEHWTIDQTVTMNNDLSGSGGGQIITQPFSPGDTGSISMSGSKNSLGRFLEKAGVQPEIIDNVRILSVKLFVNMDIEGLQHFAGEDPGHRAVLRSAQAALKSELDDIEKEISRKRSRGILNESDELIRQTWPEDTRKGKGGPKTQRKSNYLCVAFLGESLGAGSGCTKGDKCFYMHRRADIITRIEAEEALVKPADSAEKRAIQKKITEFTSFKK